MRIEQIRSIPGPNVYSHEPVLVMKLDLEDLAGKESFEVPVFIDRLLATLPGVHEHYCGLGRPGGFVERLHGGTWFGHIVEHVALELTDRAGISVNRGKTVSAGEAGKFLVAVTYKSEPGMRSLLHTAVELVQTLVDGQDYDLDAAIDRARAAVEDGMLGPSTQAIVDAATRRNIPWKRLNDRSLLQLGYGIHARRVEATIASTTSVIGVDIAGDKHATKQMLEAAGLPAPRGVVVTTTEDALKALDDIGGLVAVKPLDGNQGRGVSLNLSTPDQVREAFAAASEHSSNVVVEQQFTGRDYRVIVVNGRMVAASEKIPAHVTGDGQHTIRELVDAVNADPRRGTHHSKPLSLIKCDAVTDAYLRRVGRSFDDIPAAGECVYLRESANLSTGGEAFDVTDMVHPEVARLCERAARVIGLDIAGLDLICPNIAEPWAGEGGIIEVNAAPGIRMHHFPSAGQPRDVAGAIVDMLYPNGRDGRIPIISVTGTNGKTTTTRMLAHVLCCAGKTVGMTTTDGIWIGCVPVARGDMTGPWSAGVVLADPTTEVAVLETARGGIVRGGLGYDWSDIGIVTNIQPDHIGQDGIESVDDIVRIKALIPERVREGGAIVLNADDPHVLAMRDRRRVAEPHRRFILFSLNPTNPEVARHVAAGGTAYVVRGEWIEEILHGGERRLFRAATIPATFGGTADFQIANVLACLAAAREYGLSAEQIAEALASFDTNSQNGGRVNTWEHDGRIFVVDYGHNPRAIEAISHMVLRWRPRRRTAILGLPGDRSDDLLRESARLCARHFDRVIVREDKDLRGRCVGEMMCLISETIRSERPDLELHLMPDEDEALRFMLTQAEPGEVVVAFSEMIEDVSARIRGAGGVCIQDPGTIRERIEMRV